MIKIKHYTDGDLDGAGAAILSNLAFGENANIEYTNRDVNERIRKALDTNELDEYDFIIFTDISVNEELAKELDERYSDKLNLLDHHPTALGLNKYDWANVIINDPIDGKLTSGTHLYWKYLQHIISIMTKLSTQFKEKGEFVQLVYTSDINKPGKTMYIDSFVKLVRYYDCWLWFNEEPKTQPAKDLNDLFLIVGIERFVKDMTDEITLKLQNSTYNPYLDFVIPDKYAFVLELEKIRTQNLIDKKEKQLKKIYMNKETLQSYEEVDMNERDKYWYVGFLFLDDKASEVGNTMCRNHPEIDFMLMFPGDRFNIRNVKEDVNLMDIVTRIGGGGHPRAAGAGMSNKDIMKNILELASLKIIE